MASLDSKKYFWLKLKKDFFNQHQIKVLKSLKNGKNIVLIYIELMLESVSHEGYLRLSESKPYDLNTLSAVISEDKKTLAKALEVLMEMGMIELLEDGTYYIKEVNQSVGCETKEAQRKRDYRNKNTGTKLGQCPKEDETNLGLCHLESRDKSLESRDKSLEIEEKRYYYLSLLNHQESLLKGVFDCSAYVEEIKNKVLNECMNQDFLLSKEFIEKLLSHLVMSNKQINNIDQYIKKSIEREVNENV